MSRESEEHHYGIGAVARLTGLTDHTIRVWERRYEAVVAERAPNGRRQYTAADVEKLGLLKALTDRGLAIGSIAGESIEALRERAVRLEQLPRAGKPGTPRLAVLGELLPATVATVATPGRADLLVSENNFHRFIADLDRTPVDVVIIERPVLDEQARQELRDLVERAGADGGVIVYGFGRSRDVAAARGERLLPLRAPVDGEEVLSAVGAVLSGRAPGRPPRRRSGEQAATAPHWSFSEEPSPRRFTEQQLATLARASTSIDCECPHQLAQLVTDLSAFEVYSANCANRGEEDAALHRYLHHTTAAARAMIEAALERVAEVEGIGY